MRQRTFLTFGEQPFSPFASLAKELNRELEREVQNGNDSPQLLEIDEAFLASLDIPGVNFSDIEVELVDNGIVVSATRKNPFDRTGESSKKYSRFLTLPKHIDEEKINAHYENGVLSLTLPKLPEHKTKKKIQVSTGPKPKSWSNFLNLKKDETKALAN